VEIDENLLERARAFDEQALGQIYNAYFERLYRYAYRWVGDGPAAQDIAAETLLRWLKALRKGRPPDNLTGWLYRVTHNLAVDAHRKRPPGGTVPYEAEQVRMEEAGGQTGLGGPLVRERVRGAIAKLTPDQQEVIVLKFLEGHTNSEVGTLMGKSEGAIKSLQHRALAALRRQLG
jgi:RNA polymerase sigma-70 factor (ECF subfamily)